MTGWKARRFWSEAAAAPSAEGGWEVLLDGRAVRTPAKARLLLPSRALAEAIASEWAAQEKEIAPHRMPLTRAANAAIDKVRTQRAEVVAMLAAYGETDLLCHRAEAPAELVRRQAEAWDPLLAWCAASLGAPLVPKAGVMPGTQPAASLAALRAALEALDDFELTAAHDLVSLPGSLVIGLAAVHGQGEIDALWQASRIDETWQQELWGEDAEAAEAARLRQADFRAAARFLALSRSRD
jgi:chaperone required for assembly of F1-ATPase